MSEVTRKDMIKDLRSAVAYFKTDKRYAPKGSQLPGLDALLRELEAGGTMPPSVRALQQIVFLKADDATQMREIAMRGLNWHDIPEAPPTTGDGGGDA